MKQFKFQLKWGGKRQAFGIDVIAASIEEALAKANCFFADEKAIPANHPDAERLWVNVATPVTARAIGPIYGPLKAPDCRHYSVAQWRRAYQVKCSLCGSPCMGASAHRHQGKWICDERCWDDRLKASE